MVPPLGGVTCSDGVVATSGPTNADISNICTALIGQHLNSGLAATPIAVGATPFTVQNTTGKPGLVIISGGTVTTIAYSRDGSNFFLVGLVAGAFPVMNGDFLRIVYVLAPNMTFIPF